MNIVKSNGIIDKGVKSITGETKGVVNFVPTYVFIGIMDDQNGITTMAFGTEDNQIVVKIRDVEEIIKIWKEDKANDK